ncbi:MAG TPA: HEPN domain-containing protein [Pyrinomonadaceae bacterium]|nr:HEPN domain-containing protein [Pyrinomonadaceae bacterium]
MNPIAAEYVDKAEGDFATAQREVAATVNPNYDAVCFHAQQCAEKYLKARLQESGIMFGKTHDLTLLLNLALTVEPAWNAFLTDLQALSAFAVAYRYPGDSADLGDAQDAVSKCGSFRSAARASLSLP